MSLRRLIWKIPLSLSSCNDHYRIRSPLILLSQMTLLYTIPLSLFKIFFNIIQPSPRGLLPSDITIQILCIFLLFHTVYITYPSANLSFHRPCNIWRGITITKLLIMKVSLAICFLFNDGFGGLVVSMLASGTQVCGFKPGRSHSIFTSVKKSSACLPSEGK